MTPITNFSNWGYWDQLDGTNLVDGETLTIRWPDDTTTTERITVIDHRTTIGDMGSDYRAANQKAYLRSAFRGVEILVPLAGLLAERI